MNKKIFCFFLKCKNEKQDFQIFPKKLGKIIYENISKKAWKKWLKKQTILINEKKLSMINNNDRKFLEKELINYLFKKNSF